jgi:hypothetical protein
MGRVMLTMKETGMRVMLAAFFLEGFLLGAPEAEAQAATTNLGYAVDDWKVEGEIAAFVVDEAAAGGADLNGDGDAADRVVHVLDLASGQTTNLGLAQSISDSALEVSGGRVVFTVFEFTQGMADLTGDGDAVDLVLFVHDPASGTTINTGLALFLSRFAAAQGVIGALVREYDQGFTDLNGDGDILDAAMHAVDPQSGASVNLGLAASETDLRAGGDLLAFRALEKAQGASDLDGDGDAVDAVQHVYDATTGETHGLGLAVSGWIAIVEDGFLGFLADEDNQGADLNSDGDNNDDVLYLYDSAQEKAFCSGYAAGGGPTSWEVFDLDAGRVAFRVSESDQFHQDLNGDGDTGDAVAHVMDLPVSPATNLGVAGYDLRLEGNLLVTRASESQSDDTDLNGDGDASDRVLQLNDLVSGARENLGLHVAEDDGGYDIWGTLLFCRVGEHGQGATDLNGDFDDDDDVLFVHDVSSGLTTNLGRAVDHNAFLGPQVVLRVTENAQGADLNGDGDGLDSVLQLYDPGTGTLVNLGLAVDPVRLPRAGGPRLLFGASEAGEGADLSGDFDAADIVLHLTEHTFAQGLACDATTISLAAGGSQPLSLAAGSAHAGKLYWTLGSISGTKPGIAGPPFLPLNPDGYFTFTIQHPEVFIAGAVGTLDGGGNATALLSLPAGFVPALAGLHVDHAAVVFDLPGGGAPIWASNAVDVEVVP